MPRPSLFRLEVGTAHRDGVEETNGAPVGGAHL
jgi:hypothetical protein